MFKTAGVRSMWHVFSAFSIVSMVALLGACAHPPTADSGKPEKWVVENVKSKTTADLTADLIAPGVFVRSSSKVINGYTVESGKLRMPDNSEGALVTVRSIDGSLTALVNKLGARGLLHIDNSGGATFNPEPIVDFGVEDAIANPNEIVSTDSVGGSTIPKIIDVLIGYSQAALNAVGGDATANALAQVETVNLAFRNSLVSDISMRLVGTQIVETDYPMTSGTLSELPSILAAGISSFEPDVFYGIFLYKGEPGAGWGYVPGRSAIGNQYSATTFAHELGHNAGSDHCNTNSVSNYRFGYYNGKSGSLLCGGNRQVYYSTPNVKDEFGLPRGNAVTADTARVWRENAQRLSGYAPSFDGERMILAGVGNEVSALLTIPRQPTETDRAAGVLAYNAAEGPVYFEGSSAGNPTYLTATLFNSSGVPHKVTLLGQRSVGTCVRGALNRPSSCVNGWDMHVWLTYVASLNPTLPKGMYTGEIRLKALSAGGSWLRPIRVAVSIYKE
ncbi:M12 family metallo-peptidase [Pseudomonas sp. G(2018)]|uniref:M12 family metallo-peptidase n=1 Tax=Pseudomonas sp. G(2018) TaxID=2502242 RepID=UPI0010FA5662|nr:M12 family metallo-peptidase [Pseudomonas sp. G(2018)]